MEGVVIDAWTWAQWSSAIAALIAVTISGVSLVRSARKSELDIVHRRIDDTKGTQGEHAERLARLESAFDHLPTRDTVTEIGTSIARLDGHIATMGAKIDGMQGHTRRLDRVTERMEQFLLDQARTPK